MRKFRISTGKSRLSPVIKRSTTSWTKLATRLQRYDVIDVPYEKYLKLDREEQSNLKDVGYFIGGQFNSDKRLLTDMATRCCITLDIDHIDSWDIDAIEMAYGYYEYVVHSTLKHCAETPRPRLIFPLAHDIHPDQYEPAARAIAARMDMDCFDDTTFQPARLMFWPAVCSDGEVFKHWNKGELLDADALLDKYDDWQDFAEWPHSSRVKTIRPSGRQAEDPLTKKGIIGAFNRTFDIHAAIARFDLPYEPTEHDNRYRPLDATGPSGAVVYDDVFLYSHHESDVVGQQNVNAWDLVRLHRFSEKDNDDLNDVPLMQWPSSKQMAALALSIPEVEKELRTPAFEMEDLGSEPVVQRVNGKDHSAPPVTDLTFQSLLDEINSIDSESSDLLNVCQSMIPRIAAARLDPQEIGILAATLNKTYPKPYPGKIALEKGITISGRRLTAQLSTDGTIVDIEQDLIRAVLHDHYEHGNTIKRIGRKFWTYEQGLWAIHDEEAVKGKVIKTLSRLRVERPDDVLELVAAVGENKTSALSSSLFNMMQAELAEREARDDPLGLKRTYPLPIINCLNCELWFDELGGMEVREHNPHNFFTLRVDTEYNPKAKCPEWDRFMELIFSESCDPEDMTRHMEELGGYVIQFSRWLKTWVLFHGSKDTGKSTIAEVIKALLGNAFIGMEMSTFGRGKSDFAESGLIGKLALVDDDYDKSSALPDGFIKKISEEKSMSAAIKYGDNIQFVSRSLPMVLSNHWPVTRDVSDAFRERALVFPFTHKIAGANRSDKRRNAMMLELPGILNRFVNGLVRLRKRGDWNVPLDCYDAHQEWENKSNPARLCVNECLTMVQDQTQFVRATRIFDAYKHWSREQQSTHSSMRGLGRAELYERMDMILGDRVKHDGYPGWTGITYSVDMRSELEELEDF